MQIKKGGQDAHPLLGNCDRSINNQISKIKIKLLCGLLSEHWDTLYAYLYSALRFMTDKGGNKIMKIRMSIPRAVMGRVAALCVLAKQSHGRKVNIFRIINNNLHNCHLIAVSKLLVSCL